MENKIAEVCLVYETKVKSSDRIKVSCSQDAYEAVFEAWNKGSIEHIEEFKILLLNRANKVLGTTTISKGGVAGTLVDLKVIFQYALKANASNIILAHNHPSGNRNPSDADIAITKKAESAANFLDMHILDQIILAPGDRYFSMKDEGVY